MPAAVRRWFPPLCLLLIVAAAWVFLDRSECPDNSWDGGPAIACVEGECVYMLQFKTYLRDISLSLGLSGQGSEADQSILGDYFRGRQRLASEFGLETAAFANLAQDYTLHQLAVSEGHSPPDGEIMVRMGLARERIGGLRALLELHELARESDLAGFRNLIERPYVQQFISVQGEEHLLALFEQAGETDLSGAADGMEIHAALLESVGDDRYWNEVFVDQARRLVALESLRLAIDDMEPDLSSDIHWQDLREKTWGGTVIELTDAAPDSITLAGVRSYMSGQHALERALLTE